MRLARAAILFTALALPAAAQQPALAVADPALPAADSAYNRGDFAAAARAYDAVVRRTPRDGRAWFRLGRALAAAGEHGRAAAAFEQSVAIGHNPFAMYGAASAHARLGHDGVALDWLDSASTHGFSGLATMEQDSALARLRTSARFAPILARVRRSAMPCTVDEQARAFDFWVGEWSVRTPDGTPAGTSVIQLVSGQCALLENWTDAQGNTGKSLSAYNHLQQHWQQFWVGQFGDVTEYRDGEWHGTSLVLGGEGQRPDGSRVRRRMTYTPLSADEVRQLGEESTDGGATWVVQYDLHYHRKDR